MIGKTLATFFVAGVLALACSACGQGADDDDDAAPPPDASVQVSVAAATRQVFHTGVEAYGSVVGDPRRARVLSLGHGGEVLALDVVAGQAVVAGQTLLRLRPDPVVRSAYLQAQAALALAQSDLAHTEQLAAGQLATQSQLAAARKAQADAQVALDAQRALGGSTPEEAVVAPADGVVGTVAVHPGERFAANAPLVGFTPRQALAVALGIQPGDGARLRPGMGVVLHGVYGAGHAVDGQLRVVGHVVDPATHLLAAQVELPAGAATALAPGMAVSAGIRTADVTAWAVPRGAVLEDGSGAYLFQVDRGKARRVAVRVVSPDGATVGVDGPLDPRLPVVALGAYELGDGGAVRGPGVSPARASTAGHAP